MTTPNPFPTLSTQHLTLRKLSPTDADAIFRLRSNPEINKYLGRKPAETVDDALKFITNITTNEGGDLFYWAITKTSEDKLLGTICLFEFSVDEKKCEIGYELLPEFQGQGIMVEAARAVVEFVKNTIGLKAIDAVTHKDNQSSTALLLKLDFEEIGVDSGNADLIVFRLSL